MIFLDIADWLFLTAYCLPLILEPYFFSYRRAKLKQKYWKVIVLTAMAYVVGFLLWKIFSKYHESIFHMLLISAVFLLLYALRPVRFCDACECTVESRAYFGKPYYCMQCGAKLND